MGYSISFNLDDVLLSDHLSEVIIGAIDRAENKGLADCPYSVRNHMDRPAHAAAWRTGWNLCHNGKIIVKEV